MYKTYKVVLTTPEDKDIVEYESAEDEQEALELVLGRQGYSVRVQKVKGLDDYELLEAL
jgi:hypothetical protein